MLKTAGFSLPAKVHIHGFLTVGGEKMSKSQGHLRPRVDVPGAPRPGLSALLLRLEADLAGGRPRSEPRRVRRPGQRRHGGQGGQPGQPHGRGSPSRPAWRPRIPTTADCSSRRPPTARPSPRPTRRAISPGRCGWCFRPASGPTSSSRTMPLGTSARPGKQTKRLQDVCTIGLNLFRQLAVYLAPVLPRLAEQTGKLLDDPIRSWDQSQQPLLGTPVGRFEHLMQRVDPQAGRRHDRRQHGGRGRAGRRHGRAAGQRRAAAGRAAGRADQLRRVRQGGPAGGAGGGGRGRAGGQETLEADAQPGRRPQRSTSLPASRRSIGPSSWSAGW